MSMPGDFFNLGNPWAPPPLPPPQQFKSLGRRGIGGTQVPLPADRFGQSVMMAESLAPRVGGGASAGSPQQRAAALFGPGGQGTIQRNNFQPSMESARQQVQDFTQGGVRPGARPEMNAVERARMQGAPAGDGGPQGAALRGYR